MAKQNWILHPADRLNVARGLFAPVILFSPFWYGFPEHYAPLAVLLIFPLLGNTNYLLHLHIHRPFTGKAWLNLILDLHMGFTTGMTASNWRIQHRYGHHRGIDAPYHSNAAWELAEYSALGGLSYSIRSIWPTFWRPLVESCAKGVLANVKTPINYRWAFVEQSALLAAVLALFAWQPVLVLFFLMPWYAAIYFISRYVDYLNHYGCDESSDPYACANNSINKTFNRVCQNFGYHTAHHLRPTAHWTELPDIHARIAHRIPPRLVKTFSWSCLLLPYHCVLARRGRM
jgi:fatty acid desaturase